MGWDASTEWKTKEDVLAALPGELRPFSVLRIQGGPGGAALVMKHPDTGVVFAAVALIERVAGTWGYKFMDEGMGPYQTCGFPARWLPDLSPASTVGGHADAFRSRVMSAATRKGAR